MTKTPRPRPDRWTGGIRPRVLFVSHYAGKTGAPLLMLHFLEWVHANTSMRFEVLLLESGPLEAVFGAMCRTHVVNVFGPPDRDSLESKYARLGRDEAAAKLRSKRIAADSAKLGRFDAVYINSALAVEALRILPEIPPMVVTSLHEADTAFSHFISRQDRELILAESDGYITCADNVSDTIIGGFEVDADLVHRNYGFVSPMKRDPAAGAAMRARLGIPESAIVVGGVGVLQWRKGPDLFVAAAAEVVRRSPDLDIHFVWAGGPDPHGDDPPVADDARLLGIGDRFHLVGEYDSPAAMFSTFDLFCLSSREDAFPLVMLEAALLGVPIVGFDHGGIAELARASGDAELPLALVVDYLDVGAMADALVSLAEDPEARAALAERARIHAEAEHLPETGAERLYQDLRRLDPAFG